VVPTRGTGCYIAIAIDNTIKHYLLLKSTVCIKGLINLVL